MKNINFGPNTLYAYGRENVGQNYIFMKIPYFPRKFHIFQENFIFFRKILPSRANFDHLRRYKLKCIFRADKWRPDAIFSTYFYEN